MNDSELIRKYKEIESKIHPIKDYLELNKNDEDKKLKGVYKGIITLVPPLLYKPDILFLGINPGGGAFHVENTSDYQKNLTPLRLFERNQEYYPELNWYEKGNARKEHNKDGWREYEWFQRDKKVCNPFTQRMIDLLYEVGKLKFPKEYKGYSNSSPPFWADGFGKNLMYTNLYPIATDTYSKLEKINKVLAQAPDLQPLWEEIGKSKEWTVRLFFIRRIDELIKLVKPKLIVCAGKRTYNDFLYKSGTKDKIFTGERKHDIPVIGFSRHGNWSSLIPDLAKKIVEHL